MAHYIHDDLNNRIEGLSKEEIYALIDEVIETGELPTNLQAAFVTALKSIVDGQAYKIGFCSQAEYNALEAGGNLEPNALYIITDDSSYNDLATAINTNADDIDSLEATAIALENNKLNKSGGTMTGDLFLESGAKLRAKDPIQLNVNSQIDFRNGQNGSNETYTSLKRNSTYANQDLTIELPNKSGTVALLDDIPTVKNYLVKLEYRDSNDSANDKTFYFTTVTKDTLVDETAQAQPQSVNLFIWDGVSYPLACTGDAQAVQIDLNYNLIYWVNGVSTTIALSSTKKVRTTYVYRT